MGEHVWLDDGLIPLDEARISPLDRGFLYGDGLFETMRSYDGVVHLLRRHLDRLRSGAEVLRLRLPSNEMMRSAIYAVLHENNVTDARIRLTISRGENIDDEPTLFIRQQPLLQMKRDLKEEIKEPEEIEVLRSQRNVPEIFPRIKSLNYLPEILAQDRLRIRGFREGLMLTQEGYVAEGTVSNIFCMIGGELLTPPIDLGILPGVTRERVIELAMEEGTSVAERPFLLDELLAADECFYTNSVRELVPIGSVAGRRIGTGDMGPNTHRLLDRYRAELPDENL